jgi:hypothetical protein
MATPQRQFLARNDHERIGSERVNVPYKPRYLGVKVHRVPFQKTITFIFTAVRNQIHKNQSFVNVVCVSFVAALRKYHTQ